VTWISREDDRAAEKMAISRNDIDRPRSSKVNDNRAAIRTVKPRTTNMPMRRHPAIEASVSIHPARRRRYGDDAAKQANGCQKQDLQ
jgi:hypothetical protein